MENTASSPILVTGATGFISSHLISILLQKGYKVRGTVRSLANTDKSRFLYHLVPEKNDNLELAEVDLSVKSNWLAAVEGCEYIFHVASPIPPYVPKDEMEIIGPAVAGTINMLEAAIEKKVKKAVITSSVLAMSFGNEEEVITEEDWSDESVSPAYPKSKVRAEKAGWKIYEENKDKIQLTVVNPNLVLGPIFTRHGNSSETFIADIMNGVFPGIMDVKLGIVDVREVAQAHYNAMFNENTTGRRYICAAEGLHQEEIFSILREEFGKVGYEIPTKHVTKEEVEASGNKIAQRNVANIGKEIKFNNERSIKELNITYRPVKQTIIDMGYSLIKQGVVPNKIG